MLTTARVTRDIQSDPSGQRQFFGVVTTPDGQVIPSVDLPQTGLITPPLVGSTVLIWTNDSYGAKYICTLIDPNNSFSRMNILIDGKPAIEAGEVQLAAATGGAIIFLNANGGIHLTSGSLQEEIVIDNQQVKVAASVIDIHANSSVVGVQSHLGIDSLGSIRLGVQTPGFPSVPVHDLHIDILGNMTLSNAFGAISVSALGVATLESGPGSGTLVGGVGSVKVFPTGFIQITSATEVQVRAPVVSVDSASITLGTAGQKLATESFVKLLYDLHTHTSTTPGNPTGVPLIQSTILPLALTQVTSAL